MSGSEYNKESRKWTPKKIGSSGAGFKFSTSSKIKDSEKYEYGLDIQVVVWNIKDRQDVLDIMKKCESGMVVAEGYYKANNYTNKEGVLVKGMQFNCNAEDISTKDSYIKNNGGSKAPATSEISVDDLPF